MNYPILNIDYSSEDKIAKELDLSSIDVVVNTIGLTSVEQCELNQDLAFRLNANLPGLVAKACLMSNTKLIHISTDHFYNNELKMHSEEDKVTLLNVYSKSKYQGEIEVLSNLPSSLICRTNFFGFGPPHRQSFNDWIIDSINSKRHIKLFNDVFITPVSGRRLAKIAHKLSHLNCTGIYNISSDQGISKYDFALLLCKQFNLSEKYIQSGSISDRNDLVLRPKSMALSNKKMSFKLRDEVSTLQSHMNSL